MKNGKIVMRFLGGAGTVTGSKYLVEAEGEKILIDCGLFQGIKQLRLRNWDILPVGISNIDYVLLTHGHLDHCGYLPRLVKAGFEGKILGTEPTLEIAKVVLKDSAKIGEEDAKRANEMHYSKHKKALPLYTAHDVEKTLPLFQTIETDKWIKLSKGISCRFQYVGHILGATFIELDIKGKHIVFSGDVGRETDLLMHPPHTPEQADVLIIESTYGDRLHAPNNEQDRLKKIVSETYRRGGNIIIPSFVIERAQTLMYLLWQLFKNKQIPAMPMVVDSPMADEVLHIFRKYLDWHKLSQKECEQMAAAFELVTDYKDTLKIMADPMPKIIIAGSGMVSGGRVLSYLKQYLGLWETTVLLAGYQAEGTRGRQLVDGAAEIKFFGQYHPVRARIEQLHALSAHADQRELLNWMSQIQPKPKRVFITHGEPGASDALRVKINDSFGITAEIPAMNDSVEIPLD